MKIGIIGSVSHHAFAFPNFLNREGDGGAFPYPGVRVTHIAAEQRAQGQEIMRKTGIEHLVEDPAELMGEVDAVMIVYREGSRHLAAALPFLEAGIPTWVDKPIVQTEREAQELVAAARRGGAILGGGSTLKYIPDVQMIARLAREGGTIGKIRKASLAYAVQLDSEYGLSFYASHLVEMALYAFGYRPRQVYASRAGGVMTALLDYEDRQLTLDFLSGPSQYYATLYGEKGAAVREIDITGCYRDGFAAFWRDIQAGKSSLTEDMVIQPVRLVEAIEQSLAQNKAISL